MVKRNLVILLFPLTALLGCAGSQNSASDNGAGSPLAPYLPAPTPTQDNPPASENPPLGSYPTTNPNGYYTVSQERTLAISNSATVLGFAADPANFFMLEQVYVSAGIYRWEILSTPNQPGTGVASWTIQCNILGDNTTRLGFSADATYYYLPGATIADPNHAQNLRRFQRSDCSEVSPLDVGRDLGTYSVNHFVYSMVSSLFFFETYNGNQSELNSWNLSSGASTSQLVSANLAGATLGYADSIFVTPEWIWVMTYSAIWKLDLSGNPIAWASLPYGSPYSLEGADAIVATDDNTVVVVSTSDGAVTRYFLDVTNF